MPDWIQLMGYVLATATTALAYFSWRKAMTFHALLRESSHRFEAMRRKSLRLEKEGSKLQSKLEGQRDELKRLDKQASAERFQKESATTALREEVDTQKEALHKQELRIEHLNAQVDTITAQLKEAEYQKRQVEEKVAYLNKSIDEQVEQKKEPALQEVKTLKQRVKLLEQEAREAEKTAKKLKESTLDPEQLKDAKRKAAHYQSLFKSMRGLREMADERNKNWEVALRKLAKWILRNSQTECAQDPKAPIGPLVGEAMEVIGASMVSDEFGSAVPKVQNLIKKARKRPGAEASAGDAG